MRIHTLLTIAFFASHSVSAEYCAKGKIEANECTGFIIESCTFKKVDAVRDNKGQLYHPAKCYPSVSEYKASNNMCWINIKSKGWGIGSLLTNTLSKTDFLHKNNQGKYEQIDAEYLVFKCIAN